MRDQGRIGVWLACLIAFLALGLCVPERRIQTYLCTMHQRRISAGDISELLYQVRGTLQGAVDGFKQQVRAAHSSWRRDGVARKQPERGFIWAFSTPGADAVRFYAYAASRGLLVVRRMLGMPFNGHRMSTFSCGYNGYTCKPQRGWGQLLRDRYAVKQAHTDAVEVVA